MFPMNARQCWPRLRRDQVRFIDLERRRTSFGASSLALKAGGV